MVAGPCVATRAALAAFIAVLTALSGAALQPASAADVCQLDRPRPPAFTRNGQPLANAPIAPGNYFSFPNRSRAEAGAIMNRVIRTIDSTWGTRYTPVYSPQTCPTSSPDPAVPADSDGRYISGWTRHQGTIRMATWTFNHWGVRDALVRAERRGVSVQLIAASGINRTGVGDSGPNKSWFSIRDYLRSSGRDTDSNAWECSGACRGRGGAPHSKYFLFTDVGSSHLRSVVVQTSMNLTQFAVKGQWNQATAIRSNTGVNADFQTIFNQSKPTAAAGAYRRVVRGFVTDIFFPKGGAADPVVAALNRVRCAGGTRVRAIQYAIHGTRGNAVAKKLRALWNAGCDVRVIYSISSRPVLKILRSPSGRGRMPVRQSVIKNKRGEIVKYNHSKWLAVSGSYGGARGAWFAHAGSANWSDIAFRSDEQMQELRGYGWVRGYFAAFDKTWRQKTSKVPAFGRVSVNGRMTPATPEQPTYGSGIYRYMTPGE